MRIRLKDPLYAGFSTQLPWGALLQVISGETFDVETEHLFEDQYNTVGLPPERIDTLMARLSPLNGPALYSTQIRASLETGLRVMDSQVAEVIDDIRPDYMKCGYCAHCERIPEIQRNLGTYWCSRCPGGTRMIIFADVLAKRRRLEERRVQRAARQAAVAAMTGRCWKGAVPRVGVPTRGTAIHPRGGTDATQAGVATGGTRACALKDCLGRRIGVRWPSGRLTWLCLTGVIYDQTDKTWRVQ